MTRRLRVTRSGGFAGLRRERDVDIDDGTPATEGLRALLDSGRLRTAGAGQPDRFVYRITDDADLDVTVQEEDLSDDDRAVLDDALRG